MNDKQKLIAGLSEEVYEYLMDMILSMQIKPGDKIPEAKIGSLFGISRTPIRDAIKQLAKDGIVNIYPNRSAEVAEYDDQLIKQIGVVRASLDIVAAKLAVHNGSNAEFIEMNKFSEECLSAAKASDVAKRIKTDCAFHLELSKISKNKQLIEFQRSLYLKIEFIQACRYVKLENPQEQYKQHCDIIEALMSRNEKGLIMQLTKHNSNFHGLNIEYPLDFFLMNT